MSRTVWLNGEFIPEEQAKVPIFDRGLLFADAVYEGLGVLDGQVVDFAYHMARLRRSMSELNLAPPMDEVAFAEMLNGLIERNDVVEGFIYLHITRGVHERDYVYPTGLTSTVFAFTQSAFGRADQAPEAMKMASTPDLRWARRDIKTSNLLGQVLAKVAAHDAGADEALMLDADGKVTEGGSVSFFMVRDDLLFARILERELLPGVTRRTMLEVAEELDLSICDARYGLEDVYGADEAFVTGASTYVQPVSHVDGHQIGAVCPGPITLRLRKAYLEAVRSRIEVKKRQ